MRLHTIFKFWKTLLLALDNITLYPNWMTDEWWVIQVSTRRNNLSMSLIKQVSFFKYCVTPENKQYSLSCFWCKLTNYYFSTVTVSLKVLNPYLKCKFRYKACTIRYNKLVLNQSGTHQKPNKVWRYKL